MEGPATKTIAVLAGDGIGPEVMAETVKAGWLTSHVRFNNGKLLHENPGFILYCFSKKTQRLQLVVCISFSFFQANYGSLRGCSYFVHIFHIIISCLFVIPCITTIPPNEKTNYIQQKNPVFHLIIIFFQTSSDQTEGQNHPPPFARVLRSYKKLENSSGTPSPSKTTR